MIAIKKKEACVGCNACVERCPKQCIDMLEDEQGFLYPKVDVHRCINCNLCEKVCPVINHTKPTKPIEIYAAKNSDTKIQMSSSSGGAFFALAKQFIEENGVVFGAKFNENWDVVHSYTETIDGLSAFQGSKYVQSRIDGAFSQAERFLKEGRKVMFTGTSCQIGALKCFLGKEYERQLLTVDVICHGVPSPLVWRDYLEYISHRYCRLKRNRILHNRLDEKSLIRNISFRDKRIGWERYGFSAIIATNRTNDKKTVSKSSIRKTHEFLFETFDKNLFMQGFLRNFYLRPSCYACPIKSNKSHSDLTLGDFWAISSSQPQDYDKNGVSLILVHTVRGAERLKKVIDLQLSHSTYETALNGNPSIEQSILRTDQVDEFWHLYPDQGLTAISFLINKSRLSLGKRLVRKFDQILCRLINQWRYTASKHNARN